jgi:outer membrane biosynthesis protein TonB
VRERTRLTPTLGVSLLLHLAVAIPIALAGSAEPAARPPIYRVDLVAAPAGPRQEGIVAPQPQPPPREAAATPPRAQRQPQEMPAPPTERPPPRTRTPPAPATPTPAPSTTPPQTAPAQQAGGGPTGGRGTDVANVRTEGIEFPYPAYLQNIVRQIALRFDPPTRGALSAEVRFLIRRDGSITALGLETRSGSFEFDQEAMGAVEAAATAKAFGPLPDGFPDDVLPVVFSFDPRVLR